MFNQEK